MLFDPTKATPESVVQSAETALAAADETVETLIAASPSVEHTLAPLDRIGDLLARTWGESGFMGYVHPDPEVRTAARQVDERISKWNVEVSFRDDFAAAIRTYAATSEAAALEGEMARMLEHTERDLRKAGHALSPDSRARLRDITSRLVELAIQFETNIAEDDTHLIVDEEGLSGLPDSYRESLESGDEPRTWKVTMAYPHVVPFLDNADRRDLRRELFIAFNSRATELNRPLLEEAVRLRYEAAGLFERSSWAHHKLDDQMADNPERVSDFFNDLLPPLTSAATEEIARMSKMLEQDTGETALQAYDWRYYDTRLRKDDGIDPSEVAAYFPLDRVIEGLFDVTSEAFGIRYERVEVPAWHPDVVTYAIHDLSGDRAEPGPIAHFHMDLFPREGKFSHAAAFPLVPGRRREDGEYQAPVSAIVANFTKPGPSRPALLQHSEVLTFFHEFGHILHQTLTRAELVRFAGTSTERDFVEAPSQIMEHWVWQSEVLSRFARHHITGQPIPPELVERLTNARNLNVAISKLRQMQYGLLDLEIHGTDPTSDIDDVIRRTTAVSMLPHVEGTFYPASFGHLMGGYDAGYYGYLWSEVYGDDMFSRFEEEGLTDPTVGGEYRREILEQGGTRDAIDHMRAFLGREPNNQAFLRKLGIG